MEYFMIFSLIAVTTLAILLIRYLINRVINKGADAIRNARIDRKNASRSNEPTDLSDRFRK